MRVFVLEGSFHNGVPEDFSTWLIGVFATLEGAKAHAAKTRPGIHTWKCQTLSPETRVGQAALWTSNDVEVPPDRARHATERFFISDFAVVGS